MEKDNIVSIWLGKFNNEIELSKYLKESYNIEGDVSSGFMTSYKIDYLDNQFIESGFSESLSQYVNDLSYFDSFKLVLEGVDLEDYNAIIAVYNFEYIGGIIEKDKVIFVNSNSYQRD